MKRLGVLLATGLGLGFSPIASGTVGSLLGVAIVVAMASLSWGWHALLAAVLVVVAIPICEWAEDYFGRKDDGRIVADEYLTFPLCVIGLPWVEHYWLLGVAFLTARILDIIKPTPARQIQDLHGGLGIVLDDVVSSLYALGVNWVVFLLWERFWLA